MNDDPFAFDEDDRTVLQPSGRSTPPARATAANVPASDITQLPLLGGINKLEKAASRLLPLLVTIKNTTSHPNPQQLRNKLIRELDEFKHRAHSVLNDPKKVTQASYVMCTALDEAAMNTPWGHESNWSQHNLLATFHNEVMGGERFFALLKGLGKDPKENIDLLELMYVCLSLGYEGSYRIARNGQDTLAKVRNWLFDIIQSVRSKPATALATHWQGSSIKESKLPRLTLLWVLSAVALGIASVSYISLRYSLAGRSDRAIAQFFNAKAQPLAISAITPPIRPNVVATAPDTPAATLSLTDLLQNEIDANSITVIESIDNGKVRLLGKNLFRSGNANINPDLAPLIARISESMEKFQGTIIITGHSDNIPVRSGRFPSNLELSRARADSVLLQFNESQTNSSRVRAEGRGSLEPIAENTTAAGRSKNRRVEISIFY